MCQIKSKLYHCHPCILDNTGCYLGEDLYMEDLFHTSAQHMLPYHFYHSSMLYTDLTAMSDP